MNNQITSKSSKLIALIALTLIIAAALLTPVLFAAGGDAPAGLEGSRWTLRAINGQPGAAGTAVTAEFIDGKVAGSAGVNSYFASYTLDGGSLTIGPAGATRMMGPEPLMSQEALFLELLGSAAAAEMDGSELLISGPDGSLLFAPAG